MYVAGAGRNPTRLAPEISGVMETETQASLGSATIVYESPDGDREEHTVDNDRITYFQGHWLFAYGTDDDGNDIVRRVPRERVHHVERSVEEIEESFATVIDKARGKLEAIRG